MEAHFNASPRAHPKAATRRDDRLADDGELGAERVEPCVARPLQVDARMVHVDAAVRGLQHDGLERYQVFRARTGLTPARFRRERRRATPPAA